jgi:hypothetical protein
MRAEIRFFAPVRFDVVGKAYVVQANAVLFLEDQEKDLQHRCDVLMRIHNNPVQRGGQKMRIEDVLNRLG